MGISREMNMEMMMWL